MRDHFKVVPGEFVFATSRDMKEIDELQVFLDDSVRDGTEGLVIKLLRKNRKRSDFKNVSYRKCLLSKNFSYQK